MTLDGKVEGGKPYYQIEIEDNGPGIPDLLKSRLFNRTVRGRARTGGSGLGLFLVRSLIEEAEGSVSVGDRVTGDYTQGSRFIVILPASGNRQC
jgi:signal transduction histidine kinase